MTRVVAHCRRSQVLRVAAAWGTTIVGVQLLERGPGLRPRRRCPARSPRCPTASTAPATPLRAVGRRLGARRARRHRRRRSCSAGARRTCSGLARDGRAGAGAARRLRAHPVRPLLRLLPVHDAAAAQRRSKPAPLRACSSPLVGLSLFSSIVLHLGIIGLLIINWTPPEYQPPARAREPGGLRRALRPQARAARDGARRRRRTTTRAAAARASRTPARRTRRSRAAGRRSSARRARRA